jgi:phosphohistidine phosphatase
MILFLMRHANAGTVRENPVLDAKRGLVKEGKEQCMLMARVVGALKTPIDAIVSSPLKRARQTAQLVGTELGYDSQVEVSPALGINASYADFQKMLAKYADREGVLAVGHNPNLFQFLGRMVTGNGGQYSAAIRMRKASIACVRMDRHPPRLLWLIDPRSARAIYASVTKSSRPKTSRK